MRVYFAEFVHGPNEGVAFHFFSGLSIAYNPTLFKDKITAMHSQEEPNGVLPRDVYAFGALPILRPDESIYILCERCEPTKWELLESPYEGELVDDQFALIIRDIPKSNLEAGVSTGIQGLTHQIGHYGSMQMPLEDLAWFKRVLDHFPEAPEHLREHRHYF